MNLDNINILIIILINGSLVLLSILKILNPLKINKKANIWFGLFLLLWSTFWVEEIFMLAKIDNPNPNFLFFIHSIQFFPIIAFYYSVSFFTNPDYKYKLSDLKHTVLPLLCFTILIMCQLSTDNKLLYRFFLIIIILFQSILYTIIVYIKILNHQKKILIFASNTRGMNLNWLEYISVIILAVSILIAIYNLFISTAVLNVFLNIIFLIVIYIIAYFSLKQKEIYPLDDQQRRELISINDKDVSAEVRRKIVSDCDMEKIKEKLDKLMVHKKPYLDCDLNLIKLAELLSITPHQLSYVINTGYNENFFHYINKHRVERAKELLLSSDKNNLTILGIAFESGFSSKTSFNMTFKQITHQTPSNFKKSCTSL